MALITLAYLEIALNRPLEQSEEANAQYLINATSNYIEEVTDTAFSEHTAVTVREMADYYGLIELSPYPVKGITSVTAVTYGSSVMWYWDGLQTIYNLYPNQVVDIVYDYGMDSVPEGIKSVTAEMIKSVIEVLPEGALKSKQVGDVQHVFAESANASFNGLGSEILDGYKPVGLTFRLGRAFPNPYGGYP
jgi:hypothetical protein